MILLIIPELGETGPANLQKAIIQTIKGEFYVYEIRTKTITEYQHGIVIKKNKITFFQLIRLGVTKKIKTIQSQCFFADFAGLVISILCFCPQIIVINNNMWSDYRYKFNNVVGSFLAVLHMFLLFNSKKIIICSNECNFWALNLLFKRKIKHIPNISINDWCGKVIPATEKNNIFIIGSLIKRKNVEFLLKNLCSEKYNINVIGDGPLRSNLENAFKGVKFYGSINWSKINMPSNSVLASASLSEGYPLSVIEFIWSGGRVLLSDIQSHNEIMKTYTGRVITFPLSKSKFNGTIHKFLVDSIIQPEIGQKFKAEDKRNFEKEYGALFNH